MYTFFFFNDTATTEIYTLSLHDALPICDLNVQNMGGLRKQELIFKILQSQAEKDGLIFAAGVLEVLPDGDRKSTRLNSSHSQISYAVFCLKKKKARRSHLRPPTTAGSPW